ncbi:MAG: N-6 DNA methylase [Mycoplasmataceae bacterium RC_NB112A]|nr:MAG: N-6 DNA methylase [Mycoplasmataceae bacterium RC_NB112A]KLL01861.1 MAG: N-6 DNA methylase [Mycoplasmataceae bacterium RC_NB112A]
MEKNSYDLLSGSSSNIVDLPEGREKDYLPLEKIADIFLGLPYSLDFKIKKDEYLSNGAWKVYQQEHVINNDFLLGNRYISEEKYKELRNQYTLQPNDILISFMGTLGKVAIFPENAEKGIIYSSVAVIRIKSKWKEKIMPQYLLAICQTPQMEKALSSAFGTGVQYLRIGDLKKFPTPVLSLEKQKKAIEELNDIQKLLEIAKKRREYKNPQKSSLPLSYGTKKINDVCLINPSKSEIKEKKDIEVSFLPMEDCEEYSLWVYPQQIKKIEEVRKSYTYFAENDLLVAKITPCFENGKMSIAKSLANEIGFSSTEFIILRAKEEVMIEWVYYCLKSSDFLEEGKKHMAGTTGRQRLRQEFVENYSISLSSLEIQKNFVKELGKVQQIIGYQKQSIILLKEKKQKFLNDLW